jgi:diaminohydroxyphosphoribosylaminopyrimidine deaminase/5-amino-6-(5-phosphoribosylamino)uracil reductase
MLSPRITDADYIRRTLELASKGRALVSPGVMVGAVIVKDGRIVGEGFYTHDGVHHAEVFALREAGAQARGATVYTSLEPCSHFGRTPPCAQALIDAGVARVVTAMTDPNPLVNGKGLVMLRAAGIQVESGIHEEEARRLNEAFITYVTRKRPFGILKTAMTLDGKIATHTGESQWITSQASRDAVQQLRHSVDAVVTGSGTFLKDQPRMTDRTGQPRRRELQRVVMDRRGRVSETSGWWIFRDALDRLAPELYARQIQSFVLECGPDLAFNAIQAGIIDKIVAFVAPSILGGREVPAIGGAGVERLSDAIRLQDWSVEASGPDFVISAYVHGNH